jgi:hypothetical protein
MRAARSRLKCRWWKRSMMLLSYHQKIAIIALLMCLTGCVTASGNTQASTQAFSLPPLTDFTKTPPPPPLPSQSEVAAKCKISKLTGKKFLDMIHAIFLHGDVSDVKFIEQTLQTKFLREEITGDKNPYDRNYTYFAYDVLGTPLFINLYLIYRAHIDGKSIEPQFLGGHLYISYEDYGSTKFRICNHPTKFQLNDAFGGSYYEDAQFMGSEGEMAVVKDSDESAKNGNIVVLSYNFMKQDGAVITVSINNINLHKDVPPHRLQ